MSSLSPSRSSTRPPSRPSTRPSSGWFWSLVVLLGAISYGVLSSIVKLAFAAGYNELQVTTAQLVFGAAMLWLLTLWNPSAFRQLKGISWFRIGLVGLIGVSLTTVLINAALSYLSASLSVILLFQFTWITILMEWILYGKKPRFLHFAPVAVVLLGTLLGTGIIGEGLGDVHGLGVLFGLLSAVTYSFFLVFAGRVGTGLDPVLKSAVMMTPLLPVALLLVWLRLPDQPLWTEAGDMLPLLGWAVLLGLAGHVIPTVCFNAGIPRIGSTLSSMIGSAELPAAVVSAWILLGEHVSAMKWIGIALIVAAIIWRNRIGD